MNTSVDSARSASQQGSTILNRWMAERQAAALGVKAATSVSEITPGTEMFDVFTGYMPGGAGVPVNEQTAMMHSAVHASVSLIGGAIAALPFHIYQREEDGRKRYDSDLWWLFNEQPWPTWTAASAWSHAAQSICLRGDGYWWIHRVTPYTNSIEGFEPMHPARTSVSRVDGRNVYQYTTEEGRIVVLDQDDVLHFPGIGFDGIRSMTPLRAALRNGAGIGLAADEYAAAFFRNGARPDFALLTDKTLTEPQRESIRTTWAARHQGVANAHLPAVLQGGLKVEKLTLSAQDAQLLDTRKFQIEDIARIFGVPPHMIGFTEKTTSWGSGVEQMSIGFVRYTLRRYLDSMRQEINRKVWPKSRRIFGEHLTDALLEGDLKAQSEFWSKALGGPGTQGWMLVNEVRKLKNLPPVPGGDKLVKAGGKPPETKKAGEGADDEEGSKANEKLGGEDASND